MNQQCPHCLQLFWNANDRHVDDRGDVYCSSYCLIAGGVFFTANDLEVIGLQLMNEELSNAS